MTTSHTTMSECGRRKRRSRRGGVLFEVLLSIALFVGGGSFALSAMRTVFDVIDRSRREQFAVDLARSKMAELEAGLVNLRDLRDHEWIGDVGSLEADTDFDESSTGPVWNIDIDTTRTEFDGLNLVEITVREVNVDRFADDAGMVSYTLRQLMPLREEDVEAYQQDELIQDLPEEGDQP